jgi:predicted amidophosphoribosyltransferase
MPSYNIHPTEDCFENQLFNYSNPSICLNCDQPATNSSFFCSDCLTKEENHHDYHN